MRPLRSEPVHPLQGRVRVQDGHWRILLNRSPRHLRSPLHQPRHQDSQQGNHRMVLGNHQRDRTLSNRGQSQPLSLFVYSRNYGAQPQRPQRAILRFRPNRNTNNNDNRGSNKQ